MEEKKLDVKSIVGFVIIAILMIYMIYNQSPSQEEANKEKAKKEQIEKAKQTQIPEQQSAAAMPADSAVADSVKMQQLKGTLGAFAYSATLPSAKSEVTELKNPLLTLRVSNKGGYIAEANINSFEQFAKGSNKRVELDRKSVV